MVEYPKQIDVLYVLNPMNSNDTTACDHDGDSKSTGSPPATLIPRPIHPQPSSQPPISAWKHSSEDSAMPSVVPLVERAHPLLSSHLSRPNYRPGMFLGTLPTESSNAQHVSSARPQYRVHVGTESGSTPQLGADMGAFDMPMSGESDNRHYQMMALDTQYGVVHLPVDIEFTSKTATEKRTRNATTSAKFRKRRRAAEQGSSSSISRLDLQVRQLKGEMLHCQQDRDFLLDMVRRNNIPVPHRSC